MTLSALQDLFRRHRERETGVWKLGQDPNRIVYLDSGDIVFAQSTHPLDRMTHLLVERGKLTQEQLDYAMGNLKPGLSIGKNLIEMGFITQRDLLEVVRAQVERVVWGALGTPDTEPEFASRDLDASIVRLPFDTPSLLLNCLLNLQDRERLLELLGPLNQVVALQGRRLQELPLPPDLAKLPPLLDGSRTLLELGREVAVEPIRLGILALFLREIGWARLHELPPLDRGVLDLALTAEAQPLASPLPPPSEEPAPTLFSTIQAAAAPTTNLEHLSHALDSIEPLPEVAPGRDDTAALRRDEVPLEVAPELPIEPVSEPEPEPEPQSEPEPEVSAAPDLSLETSRAFESLPTPNVPLPEPSEAEMADPAMPVQVSEEPSLPMGPPVFEEAEDLPAEGAAKPRGRGRLFGLLLGLLIVLVGGGYLLWKRRSAPKTPAIQPPEVVAPLGTSPGPRPVAPSAAGIAVPTEPPTGNPSEPKPEPKPPEPPKPEPKVPDAAKPEPPNRMPSLDSRLEALRKGDLPSATAHGQAYRKALPSGRWTLRLLIACQGETLRSLTENFGEGKPDIWILPLGLKDGRTCYQVFLGAYPSRASAEKAVAGLPRTFTAGGNRPRPYAAEDIPAQQ